MQPAADEAEFQAAASGAGCARLGLGARESAEPRSRRPGYNPNKRLSVASYHIRVEFTSK